MGHYKKLEEFQITNTEIIDLSDFLFSKYKLKVESVNQFMSPMIPSFDNDLYKILLFE